jgi:hypothetical protein
MPACLQLLVTFESISISSFAVAITIVAGGRSWNQNEIMVRRNIAHYATTAALPESMRHP